MTPDVEEESELPDHQPCHVWGILPSQQSPDRVVEPNFRVMADIENIKRMPGAMETVFAQLLLC
jgi:hypothetical protein